MHLPFSVSYTHLDVYKRQIYTLVGLAGVWCITMLFRETEPIEGDAHA